MPIASDNFNRADGVLGPNWTQADAGDGSIGIADFTCDMTGPSGSHIALWNANAFPNDQLSQLDFTGVTKRGRQTALRTGICVRAAISNAPAARMNGYAVLARFDTNDSILVRCDDQTPDVGVVLASGAYPSAGSTIVLKAVGTTITAVGGGVNLSVVDATYGSGTPGMVNASGPAPGLLVPDIEWDNWVGDAAITPPPPPQTPLNLATRFRIVSRCARRIFTFLDP